MVFNTHSLNVAVAVKYGATKALVLQRINSWINHNEANNSNFHDGRYWVYNSVEAWTKLIPYFSYEQMRKILRDLESDGLIVKGSYNKSSMDKTSWYAITDKGYAELSASYAICEKTQIDVCESTNGNVENHSSVCEKTQSNTTNKTTNKTHYSEKDIDSVPSSISKERSDKPEDGSDYMPHPENPDTETERSIGQNCPIDEAGQNPISQNCEKDSPKPKKKRFMGVNPSKEDVEAYIRENGFHVSASRIIGYYTNEGGMKVWRFKNGTLVRDWKRCVCTCERNWKDRNADKPADKSVLPDGVSQKDIDYYTALEKRNQEKTERMIREMMERRNAAVNQ